MVVNSSRGCWLPPLFKIANLLSGSSHSLLHFLSLETKKAEDLPSQMHFQKLLFGAEVGAPGLEYANSALYHGANQATCMVTALESEMVCVP